MLTKEELIAFEADIAEEFSQAKIHAPVHLADGNEEQLLEVFQNIKPDDWVFSTWRSHYHALLHGVDPAWLRGEIMAGRSITIMNRDRNFFSSAIVGGTCPIALGVALGIKRGGGKNHVWCFVGDMTAETGAFYEAVKYARGFSLPATFVVEDNKISTTTPTGEVWGGVVMKYPFRSLIKVDPYLWYYAYDKVKYPHQGLGKWIQF